MYWNNFLTREQIKVLYREHPQLLLELLLNFSELLKNRVIKDPANSITMSFTPKKDEALDIERTKRFDLIDAVDAINEVLAKQLNYKGWVE